LDHLRQHGSAEGWREGSEPLFPRPRSPRRTLSLSEQIAEQIGEAILREEYRPGASLTETTLAAHYDVSRGPVRDALRILEKEGLVEILPRRGARVTELSIEEVSDIFEIREVLLGLAARRLAATHGEGVLGALEEGLRRLAENAAGAASLDVHQRVSAQMNQLLATESGNARLGEMVFVLARQIARYTRLGLSTPERRCESVEGWARIIEAIREGRAEEAERLQRHQVRQAQAMAIALLRQGQVTSRA